MHGRKSPVSGDLLQGRDPAGDRRTSRPFENATSSPPASSSRRSSPVRRLATSSSEDARR